jgi:predicted HAD superfamily Cof-like phosphohydrolase
MTNPFRDQAKFMTACDQSVGEKNSRQYEMYYTLIKEEVAELMTAHTAGDRIEQLDALIDILVVTIGAIHSMGANGEGAWNEVMRTNFAKIDQKTGKVNKRNDGKVLKPEGWQPPQLSQFLDSEWDHYSDLPSPEAYR